MERSPSSKPNVDRLLTKERKLPPPAYEDPVLISIWVVGAVIGIGGILTGGIAAAFGIGMLGGVAGTYAMVRMTAKAPDPKDEPVCRPTKLEQIETAFSLAKNGRLWSPAIEQIHTQWKAEGCLSADQEALLLETAGRAIEGEG